MSSKEETESKKNVFRGKTVKDPKLFLNCLANIVYNPYHTKQENNAKFSQIVNSITSIHGNIVITWGLTVTENEIRKYFSRILLLLSDSNNSVSVSILPGPCPYIDLTKFVGRFKVSMDEAGNQWLTLTSSAYSKEGLTLIIYRIKRFFELAQKSSLIGKIMMDGSNLPVYIKNMPSGCRIEEGTLYCSGNIPDNIANALLQELKDLAVNSKPGTTVTLVTVVPGFEVTEGVSKLPEEQIYPVPDLAPASVPTPAKAPAKAPVPTLTPAMAKREPAVTPASIPIPVPTLVHADANADDSAHAPVPTPAPVLNLNIAPADALSMTPTDAPADALSVTSADAPADALSVTPTDAPPAVAPSVCYVNGEICSYFPGTNGFAVISQTTGAFQVATLPAVLVDGNWVFVTFPQLL